MASTFGFRETTYGFDWGPASIERCASGPKWGVILTIKTKRQSCQLRVTPSGLIRFSMDEAMSGESDPSETRGEDEPEGTRE